VRDSWHLPENWHSSQRWAVAIFAGLGVTLILRLAADGLDADAEISRWVWFAAGLILALFLAETPKADRERMEREKEAGYSRLDEDPAPDWLIEASEEYDSPEGADD
jgi:hypothetical protein